MASNTYITEYARSGRSKCKDSKCKKVIAKHVLRIGKVAPNPFGDDGDTTTHWYHAPCIFSAFKRVRKGTKIIEGEDDIEGYDDLKKADQKVLQSLIAGEGVPTTTKKAPKSKAKPVKKSKPQKKKVKKAAAPSGDGVYLTADSASGGKFWSAKRNGCSVTVTYGKVGSAGSSKTKEYDSEAAAQKDMDKQCAAKIRKGYDTQ